MTTVKSLVFACVLATWASGAAAQSTFATYGVADWQDVVPERRVEFQTFRTIVLTNSTISDDEKARRVAAKFIEVQEAVRKARLDAYGAVVDRVGIGNSATKGSSGGDPKVSDAKCRGANYPNMFTTPQWARGAYKSGNDDAGPNVLANGSAVNPAGIVTAGGEQVCAIRLKQSGRGRKVAWSEAEFRIKPEQIKALVDAELPLAMDQISRSPV